VKVPSAGGSAKRIAKGKGVHREVESEESLRQTTSLTYRKCIRQSRTGKAAVQAEAQMLHGGRGCRCNRHVVGKRRGLPREASWAQETV